MKPVITWVGGKRRMLKYILPHIPEFEYYHEPFFGGGSVFFALEPKLCSSINDSDKYLMRFYHALCRNVEKIMMRLDLLAKVTDKESYLFLRDQGFAHDIDFAAKYIYFNKLAFSGIMRFNTKTGNFNVPYRRKVNKLYDADHLRSVAKLLGTTHITNLPFREYFKNVLNRFGTELKNHVFYLDPPYLSTHADYAIGFSTNDMTWLSRWSTTLRNFGATVIISNNITGAKYFEDYECLTQELLYSVNPKYIKGKKQTEVLMIGKPYE